MDEDLTDARTPEEKRATHAGQHPDLRERLDAMSWQCTQEAATERPFTGGYCDEKRPGTYTCVACGEALFTSEDKYDSECGWPSFTTPMDDAPVDHRTDTSHGMSRTETTCGPVAPTWATSSMTAPDRQATATASTRPAWSWRNAPEADPLPASTRRSLPVGVHGLAPERPGDPGQPASENRSSTS